MPAPISLDNSKGDSFVVFSSFFQDISRHGCIERWIEVIRSRKEILMHLGEPIISALVQASCYEVMMSTSPTAGCRYSRKDPQGQNFPELPRRPAPEILYISECRLLRCATESDFPATSRRWFTRCQGRCSRNGSACSSLRKPSVY